MSAKAIAGSDVHRFIYNVVKFFALKFVPGGPVQIAQIIGKIGVALGAMGSIFGIFAQVSQGIRGATQASDALRFFSDSGYGYPK